MQKNSFAQKTTVSALLIALGLLIPMFSPIKILLEPASFTLASHVPVMLSMFVSPFSAAAVAIGTTLGFLFGGFPIVVVARAASHLLFALPGALLLQKQKRLVAGKAGLVIFCLLISAVHALGEIAAVSVFYFAGMPVAPQGFVYSVIGLVGLGTLIHSAVDYVITLAILKPLSSQKRIAALFESSPFTPPA